MIPLKQIREKTKSVLGGFYYSLDFILVEW